MKKADSYPTLLQGVSQQAPHARLPGQHGAQVNLLPDPVTGLARRQGSVYKAGLTRTFTTAALAELASARTLSFRYLGRELVISLPQTSSKSLGQPCVVFDRTSEAIPTSDVMPPYQVLLDLQQMLLDLENVTLPPT